MPDCSDSVEVGPTALDLRGRRLAFSWSVRGGFCDATGTSVWLDSLGGGQRRVDRTCHSSLQGREMVAPTISGGGVYYVRSFTGGDLGVSGSVRHYGIRSHRRIELFLVPGRVVVWSATDAGRTFYLLGSMPDPVLGNVGPGPINERTP